MEELKYERPIKTNKKHPFERSNIITRIFFCWFLPYFAKGYKRDLTEEDMCGALKAHEAEMLGDKLEDAWNYEIIHRTNPSLWRALLKTFRYEIILYALFFLLNEIIKLTRPLLITKFLTYYEPNQTEMSKNEACMYAALFVLATLIMVLSAHHYILGSFHLAMKMRVAATSLIYRKALKLSKFALVETTIGQMVNLLSNDIGRFDVVAKSVHFLWLTPIETVVVMYLVYAYVGPTGLAGAFFLLLFIPFQMYMGKKTSQYRLRTALRTDERVRLMSEIITGIQVIKMYTWEKPFAKLVELSRKKEIQQIQSTSVIRAMVMSFNLFLNRAAVYICILTYVLTGNTLNATYAYTITSFYGVLRNVVTKAFPKAVTNIAEANVSVSRIKKFLLYDEMELRSGMDNIDKAMKEERYTKNSNKTNGFVPRDYKTKSVGIHMKNVSVKWIKSLPENILENVSLSVESNQLVAIVGPVGGGKTTLLQTILKELPPVEGSVDVNGSLSYASQEPWLFGGSVRQNIIFGQEFDSKKYEEVVRVCALEMDFSLFPHGDRTLVGGRGATLSGGQRARINLARAVYKDADIYLLDDPLSAVDTHVGKQLFDECICGYLKNKCVVLVTHQLQYLRNVGHIYLIENGKIEVSGTYTELQASDNEFTTLLTNNQDQDEQKYDKKEIKEKGDKVNSNQDAPEQKKEFRSSGVVSSHVYKSYLRAGGSWFKMIMLFTGLAFSQILASSTDYFVSIWVNLEQWRSEQKITSYNETLTYDTETNNHEEINFKEAMQLFFNLILSQENSIIIYTFLVVTTIAVTLTRSIAFFRYCIAASRKLHNLMFDKIVYGTMRFFNTNPSGRILNRFSKDVGAVDETLPITFLDTLETAFNVGAISLVIGSLNPWIFIPTIIILVIFYYLRLVFLATSRDIKRLEAITRSPIYTHLSASLQGLATIRAFGAQGILRKEFDNFQNQYSGPCYMFLTANRTFGFWLDVHCVVYIALVTISILFIESEMFGGNVGLALTQSMTLTGMFQWGMRQWSELENTMTSVERIQEYTEISPEKDENTKNPPRFWPEGGNIKFDRVSLRYSLDDPYVLNNLSFEIKRNEKVGIVGRTGAGKSSLITALFRLTEIDGRVLIDGVNTKEIPLNILRSKISIIPQEPVLFSGTLRNNLDPFDEYNDDVLWSALAEVELKNAVNSLPAGLDSKVSEGGSNFSVGQRQLLCLARAIIRNNKILVLDEATANVDPQTDALIQATIRQKFVSCTVLTIAHRLYTIMDSDKVLVMDGGKAVEFDHPHKLLQNHNGVFYKLVKQTGNGMAQNLMTIAEENYRDISS